MLKHENKNKLNIIIKKTIKKMGEHNSFWEKQQKNTHTNIKTQINKKTKRNQ